VLLTLPLSLKFGIGELWRVTWFGVPVGGYRVHISFETLAVIAFPSSPTPFSQSERRGAGKLCLASPSPIFGRGELSYP